MLVIPDDEDHDMETINDLLGAAKDYKKDKITYRYQLIKCKCGQILGLKIESTNVNEFKELEKCCILLKDKIAYSIIYG